jgi:hypothetical protein
MAEYTTTSGDLIIGILNVGFGDSIAIRFPKAGTVYPVGVVDCCDFKKMKSFIEDVTGGKFLIEFICATHPHADHIRGIDSLLKDKNFSPREFWDSGFRHNSTTYRRILTTLKDKGIRTIRASSGMERYIGAVSITVVAPSISLRNRYATYGVDMNNASIVLRLEHHARDALDIRSEDYEGDISREMIREAGSSVVILAGDAEFDSWSHIVQEFPKLEKQKGNEPLISKMVNYLACHTIKVAHHGSMHSSPLDIYEKMGPKLAVISTKQESSSSRAGTRNLFPHDLCVRALEECDAGILTTDGSHDTAKAASGRPGTVVIAVPPGEKPRWTKLGDGETENAEVQEVMKLEGF